MKKWLGWCAVSTPQEEDMVKTRNGIKEHMEEATPEKPAAIKLEIGEWGTGGYKLLARSGYPFGVLNPIGYLVPHKKSHPVLGSPASRTQIKEFVENGIKPCLVGQYEKKYIVAFYDQKSAEREEMNEFMAFVRKSAGIAEDDLYERVTYMQEHGVSKENIVAVLRMYNKVEGVVKPKSLYQPIEERDVEGEVVSEGVICRMIRNIVVGNNILLEGPKSTGKNVAWETIAWLTNRQLCSMTMNSEVSKEDMFGMYTTDNSPSESLTENNLSSFLSFLKALFKKTKESCINQEQNEDIGKGKTKKSHLSFMLNVIKTMGTTLKFVPGFVGMALVDGDKKISLIDEMNMGRANILSSAFNTLCDDHSTSVYIPGMGRIPIPQHLIIGATQNGEEDGMMSGIQMQNEATLSRFVIIRMTPSSGSVKNIFVAAKTGASEEQIELADKIFCHIRDGYLDGALSGKAVSIRNFNMFLRNVANGQPIKEALLECILYQCETDECRAVLSSLRTEGIL